MTSPAPIVTPPFPTAPPELPVQETERALVAYVDSRIKQLDANVDNRINRLDADMTRRLTKQDEMMDKQDGKLDKLLEFRPATEQRLNHLEAEVEKLQQRPLKSWQVFTGGIGLVLVLVSTAISVVYDTIILIRR